MTLSDQREEDTITQAERRDGFTGPDERGAFLNLGNGVYSCTIDRGRPHSTTRPPKHIPAFEREGWRKRGLRDGLAHSPKDAMVFQGWGRRGDNASVLRLYVVLEPASDTTPYLLTF